MAILPLLTRSLPAAALAKAGFILSTASLALGIQAPAEAVCMGFADDCAASEWQVFVERNSNVDFSGEPGSVVLTSSDGVPGGPGPFFASFMRVAPVSGFVTFRYVYSTTDDEGSELDPFGYMLDNERFQLSPNGLAANEIFEDSFTFDVIAGQTFGFYAASIDAEFGPSTTTISNFVYEVPGPLPAAGAAAAFGYSRKLRKRIRVTGGSL